MISLHVCSSIHCDEASALFYSFLCWRWKTMASLLLHPVHTSQSLFYDPIIVAYSVSFQGLTSSLTILSSSSSASSLNVGVLYCSTLSFSLFSLYALSPRTSHWLASTAIAISLNQTFYPTVIDTSKARCVIHNTSFLSLLLNITVLFCFLFVCLILCCFQPSQRPKCYSRLFSSPPSPTTFS